MSILWLEPVPPFDELPARLGWEAVKTPRNAPDTPTATTGSDEPPVDLWWMADNGLIDARPDGFRTQQDPCAASGVRHP